MKNISTVDTRIQQTSWFSQWIVFTICLVSIIVVCESILRYRGAKPSIQESKDLWCLQMQKALDSQKSKKTIVVVGQSRVHLGFSPDIFQDKLNTLGLKDWQVVLVGLDGKHPQPVLEYLAKRKFNGIVLFSFDASWLSRHDLIDTQAWVDYYDKNYFKGCAIDRIANLKIKNFFQENLTILSNGTSRNFYPWSAYRPNPFILSKNGQQRAYFYDMMSQNELQNYIKRLRKKRLRKIERRGMQLPAPFTMNNKNGHNLENAVLKIKASGGKVIFLRMPTKDIVWENENKFFPRKYYWDKLVKYLEVPSIHFKDMGDLTMIKMPDLGGHMGCASADVFTGLLFEYMKKHNLLPCIEPQIAE